MNKRDSERVFYPVAVAIVVSVFGFIFLSLSNNYPYYFIWDMDLTTVIDSVLIHSHELPVHVNHPGFGMYLWFAFSHQIAYWFHWVSILNLDDLTQSLVPISGMAELTAFFRLNSVFMVMAIPLALWWSIIIILEVPWLTAILGLIFIFTQQSLFYHASLIRTEVYAVFYWSLTILTCAFAAREKQKGKKSAFRFFLVLSGIFMGLTFLTKLQSFFYLLMVPLFLLSFLAIAAPDNGKEEKSSTRLSLINLILFLILLVGAYGRTIPHMLATFETDYRPNRLCFLFIAIFGFLFLMERKPINYVKKIFAHLSALHFLFLGFIVAFLLHFLIYPSPVLSLKYLLIDTKMLFMRAWIDNSSHIDIDTLKAFVQFLKDQPLIYANNLALGFLVIRSSKRNEKWVFAFLLFGIYLNLLIQRGILRDFLWMETAVTFSTVLFIFLLIEKKWFKRWAPVLMLLLCLIHVRQDIVMPQKVDLDFVHYGWDPKDWLAGVYPGQADYAQIMSSRFSGQAEEKTKHIAFMLAPEFKERRREVGYTFANQVITQKNIGILNTDFPVWSDQLDTIITEFPSELANAIVVDSQRIPTKDSFFKADTVNKVSMEPYKLQSKNLPSTMAILPRTDLEVIIFVEKNDEAKLSCFPAERTGMTVSLKNQSNSFDLSGWRVKNYSEIPISLFSGRFFFVVRKVL